MVVDRVPKAVTEAFHELTPEAFSVWIMLQFVPGDELQKGRQHLARTLSLHPRTLNRRLRELQSKGYVRIKRDRQGLPSRIGLQHNALINEASAFIKLC